MSESPVDAVVALLAQWREMHKQAEAEGPIVGDEIGHPSRWTAVEMCADELEAALARVQIARPPQAPVRIGQSAEEAFATSLEDERRALAHEGEDREEDTRVAYSGGSRRG